MHIYECSGLFVNGMDELYAIVSQGKNFASVALFSFEQRFVLMGFAGLVAICAK